MSWYRLYRPQTVAGLHSASIRSALEKIRQSGQFSHAYLLVGPRGTGKTTSARILARMLNCEQNRELVSQQLRGEKASGSFVEPCGACVVCQSISAGSSMCVTEIDAASNNGIEGVRSLQEFLGLSSPDGLIRVCILDEVHMFSKPAFNGLLKVLEEPPKHVVFVLATTNPEKVPATVVSRCQVLQSRRATTEEMISALQGVAKAEGVDAEESALNALAEAADGSFRDAVKLFEQACWGRKSLSLAEVEAGALGQVKDLNSALLTAIEQKDAQAVGKVLQDIQVASVDPVDVQKMVMQELHDRVLQKGDVRLLGLLKHLNQPVNPNLPFPALPFELACLEWCLGAAAKPPQSSSVDHKPTASVQSSAQPSARVEHAKTLTIVAPATDYSEQTREVMEKQKTEKHLETGAQNERALNQAMVSPISSSNTGSPMSQEEVGDEVIPIDYVMAKERWGSILAAVGKKTLSLNGVLKTSQPISSEQHMLTIEVGFPFHKDKLEEEKHRRLLESAIGEVCGWPRVRLLFTVNKSPTRKFEVTAKSTASDGTPSSAEDALADAVASELM